MSASLGDCPQCHGDNVVAYQDFRIYKGGALYWVCENEACGYAWPRTFLARPKLAAISRRYADRHNRMRQQ